MQARTSGEPNGRSSFLTPTGLRGSAPEAGGKCNLLLETGKLQPQAEYIVDSLLSEKRHQKNHFNLCEVVHSSEYQNVKKPIDTRTDEPIEPAHNFEVSLEPDNFTEEKYHEDVHAWNFGKLSALREIALALEDGYQYYYMDPISYSWDVLDDDLLQRLGARQWVSMSLERAWALSPATNSNSGQSNSAGSSDYQTELHVDPESIISVTDYVRGPEEDLEERSRRYTTVFQAGTPGALSLQELQDKIDLGKWNLKIGNRMVRLEDLEVWDEEDISEPGNVKNVTAELAACIGPDLVKKIALKFN
ncbi:Arginyl-tRNA--protein transferase 1 [Lecanora helva]